MNVLAVLSTGDLEVLALRCPRADEYRIVAFVQQLAHAVDWRAESQVDAHVDDVTDLLVEHVGRQPECRNVVAHEATRDVECLIDDDFVTQRHEIVGNG